METLPTLTAAGGKMAVAPALLTAVLSLSFCLLSCGGGESPDTPRPDSRLPSLQGDTAKQKALLESLRDVQDGEVTPFTNVAPSALDAGYQVWNDRPGAVVFDYDRDGDLDFLVTAGGGSPNLLYRNDGDGSFTDVARQAGVDAVDTHSTGAVACDVDNDGYQDLYVAAWGNPNDGLDFRSPNDGNVDHLFLNAGDGTFRDVTSSAFGDAVNLRSATSPVCADVDGDGWVDIFVANLADDDFRQFAVASHPGHYDALYRNNGDLTFTEVAEEAGVRGTEIVMRDPGGQPVRFGDPETGESYQGYDPRVKDRMGNRVGEPTSQAHAALFFDYDDDGDPDLWVANDGDRLYVYRNDSEPGRLSFTPVSEAMGVDQVGAWMGFAVGDYDGDADLDVFVTNIGYHARTRPPPPNPNGSCEYHDRFEWGTCLHYLLRNDGTREVEGVGTVGVFAEVAASTVVEPSPIMPPDSLDPSRIHPAREMPKGLAAYDFGFGTTFFDYDNDGDQDLYWLGSTFNRGAGPGGEFYPAAGRMLRGDGRGTFEDITVRAHLLDIVGVDYSVVDSRAIGFDALRQRIAARFHENGKGLAHGDLNGDGYVDLIGTNSSGLVWEDESQSSLAASRGPFFVWINGGGEGHWITLRLRGRMAVDGTGSNADGIGARVRLTTGSAGGVPLVQVQEVRAGSSYLSMDSLDLEFGVGDATVVDEIEVVWPSGRRQTLQQLSVDRVVDIVEPEE